MKKIDKFIDTSITHRAPNKEEKYKYYVILDSNDEEELYRMISSIKKEKVEPNRSQRRRFRFGGSGIDSFLRKSPETSLVTRPALSQAEHGLRTNESMYGFTRKTSSVSPLGCHLPLWGRD